MDLVKDLVLVLDKVYLQKRRREMKATKYRIKHLPNHIVLEPANNKTVKYEVNILPTTEEITICPNVAIVIEKEFGSISNG